MRKDLRILLVIAAAVAALLLAAATPAIRADDEDDDEEVVEFDELAIFFEYNSTDKDLGIQIFFDATGWKEVEVQAPDVDEDEEVDDWGWRHAWGGRARRGERREDDGAIFEVENGGGLRDIGSTEIFTESAEPPLCPEEEEDCDGAVLQAAIDAFLMKFPEGTYEFEGETIDGRELEGEAELSWDLPTPVELVDVEENFPTIDWTESIGIEVVAYQVVAEMVVEGPDDDEIVYVQATDVPATVTMIETSPQFAELAEQFEMDGSLLELKVEVIAVGENGNKTITEEPIFEAEE
jgi:hypothetical protein